MSELALRLARLGDAPRIANLSRTLIEAGLPWSWTPRRVAAHMRSREHLTVIATDGGELAGFVLAQFGSRAVHVALLGVAPAYQRHGLGRQLIALGRRECVGRRSVPDATRGACQQPAGACASTQHSAIARRLARPGTTAAWKMRSGSSGIWP